MLNISSRYLYWSSRRFKKRRGHYIQEVIVLSLNKSHLQLICLNETARETLILKLC